MASSLIFARMLIGVFASSMNALEFFFSFQSSQEMWMIRDFMGYIGAFSKVRRRFHQSCTELLRLNPKFFLSICNGLEGELHILV